MLADAVEILRISEVAITEQKYRKNDAYYFNLFTSVEVIRIGMGSFISPCLKFIGYWIAGLLIIWAAAQFFTISPVDLSSYRFFTAIIAFVLVAFALPSAYVTDSLSDAHIEVVVIHMNEYASFRKSEIDALAITVKEFHERALARVNAFQWILGAGWAIATYLFSQYAGMVLKISPATNIPQQLFDAGLQMFLFALFSLFVLWAVFGYKRSVDKTFRLSRLALRQMHLALTSNE